MSQYSSASSLCPEVERRASSAVSRSLLDVPHHRERNYSLPSNLQQDLYTVRLFSVEGGRVVSHGESVQSSLSGHSSSPCLASQERREDLTKVLMLGAGGSGKSSLCAQGRPLNLPETNTSIFQLSSI